MHSCHVRSSTIDESSYINEVIEYCVHGKYLMQLDGWKTNYSAEINGKIAEKIATVINETKTTKKQTNNHRIKLLSVGTDYAFLFILLNVVYLLS